MVQIARVWIDYGIVARARASSKHNIIVHCKLQGMVLFFFLGLSLTAPLACGSMVFYVPCVSFFARPGEK
jgi:hypothetical protein